MKHQRAGLQGFTLLEVLVVIVIVGIIVSMAVLTLGDRRAEQLDRESRRLAAIIELAKEEAILQSRIFGLVFWRGGYAFQEPTTAGWQTIEGDRSLGPHELPEDLRMRLYLEGVDVDLKLALATDIQPQVYIFSSGEVFPFAVDIEDPAGPVAQLEVDPIGNVDVELKTQP